MRNVFNNNRILWPLKISVTVVALYLVYRSLSKSQLIPLLNRLSFAPIAVATLLGAGSLYLQVVRWRIILLCTGIAVDRSSAWRTMLWGSLLAFITPGRTGELFRATGLPLPGKNCAVFSVLLDKMFAGGAVVVAGVFFCLLSIGPRGPLWGQRVLLIGAALMAALAGIAACLRKGRVMKNLMRQFPPLRGRPLVNVVMCSAAAQLALLVQTAVLFRMLGSQRFFEDILACGQAYAFMLFFPFFIANMGIREFSFGMFQPGASHARHGFSVSSIALGASMGVLVLNIVVPALAGLVWWLLGRNKKTGAL
jgi:F0F1-type ATP synthase membrane subunit c/vacuolar-type H+-ATPase subunit K